MRAYLLTLLICASGAAAADDLSDAKAAQAAKDYPTALTLYQKLVAANNADAQVGLGEMLWYGEGMTVDRARADSLFAKAAAAGNAKAAVDLRLSGQRAGKLSEISYWTTSYRGDDLTTGKLACPAPVAPTNPEVNRREMEQIAHDFNAWKVCYEGFISNIGDLMPLGKQIPEDVSTVMSEAEMQQAREHLHGVYSEILQQRKAESAPTMAELEKWRLKATKFVSDRRARGVEMVMRLNEYNIRRGRGGVQTAIDADPIEVK